MLKLRTMNRLCIALMAGICLLATACRTSRQLSREALDTASGMLAAPAERDVAGKLSVTWKQNSPVTLRVNMRWNSCIHVSYSLFGLLEVADVDILPDRIVIVNRNSRTYCEIPYGDIPYNNLLKLDFTTLQGILWGRLFSSGSQDPSGALHQIRYVSPAPDGGFQFADGASDFRFVADAGGNLVSLSRHTLLYNVSAEYFGRVPVSGSCTIPSAISITLGYGKSVQQLKLRYSSVGRGDDRGDVRTPLSGYTRISPSEMESSFGRILSK